MCIEVPRLLTYVVTKVPTADKYKQNNQMRRSQELFQGCSPFKGHRVKGLFCRTHKSRHRCCCGGFFVRRLNFATFILQFFFPENLSNISEIANVIFWYFLFLFTVKNVWDFSLWKYSHLLICKCKKSVSDPFCDLSPCKQVCKTTSWELPMF